jgi:ABC-type lipoprotein release transport system permease subunit
VRGVTTRTRFLGELSNYAETTPVAGLIIDPAADTSVFSLKEHIEGSYFSADNVREIILGKRLAQDFGVDTGDFIALYALTKFDSRNADEFRIVGLLTTTDPMLNRGAVCITYTAAEEFLDIEGLVTELDVAVKRKVNYGDFERDVIALQKAARAELTGYEIDSYLDIGADFFKIAKIKSIFGFVFMGFILLIAAVGIFNTVFMSVYERIREIGVLRAHGLRPAQITLMFLLEGAFTGVAGSVLGLALGCALNFYLVAYGFPVEKIAGEAGGAQLPIWGTIYGQWNIGALVAVFLFGIAVAIIAGIAPSHKASSIEVTQALKFV